jgi:protein-S-isoprenylcysteine O-methyltransferase Ste14
MSSRLPKLGARGEGWVVAQLVLFLVIAAAGLVELAGRGSGSGWGAPARLVGGVAILAGGLVAGRGAWDLRASLSPFPRPVAGAQLIESGAYRLIRHPIYSGLILVAIGWGLATSSILAIVAAGLLFLLFDAKSRLEEVWLSAAHPEYEAYAHRTKRLIPWLY